jgi:CheY-like chemotaxis protein
MVNASRIDEVVLPDIALQPISIINMDKVLIVDDDLKFQRILRARLQKHKDKFEIILANNGAEAIKVLQQNSISVVVTDIQMPKVDGLELLTHIKESYPKIPCFVMTAYGTAEIKEKLSKSTLRIFNKPFRIDELADAVIQVLQQDAPGGTLKGISVSSFLQLIQMEEKTCFLEIISNGDKKGYFYFKDGVLYDAAYGGLKGEAAAFRLLALNKASIRLKNLCDDRIVKQINISLMNLIMESLRRKDESKEPGEFT